MHEAIVEVTVAASPETVWRALRVEGWITFMQQLRFALERHPGEERRTIHRSGSPGHAADLAGDVWFRSDSQLGVTVRDWNDGLLVVTDRTWTASAYGLDERAFAELERRLEEAPPP